MGVSGYGPFDSDDAQDWGAIVQRRSREKRRALTRLARSERE
jgi:hypothetical protein